MKNKKSIYWIVGLVVFALVASIFSRVLGAALSAPPLLFAIIFAVVALIAVLVFAIVKKFPKRWLWTGLTLLAGVVSFVYVAAWTNGEEYYKGYLASNDKLYDKGGSILIDGYDDYYFVELGDKSVIVAVNTPKVKDSWSSYDVFECVMYELDGKKIEEFEIPVDRDERLQDVLIKQGKVHKF